jgi:hypothetical protein
MNIKFNPYRRRDGTWMIYVNNDRGVSIGLSEERGFSPYGRDSTEGKRKLFNAMMPALRAAAENRGPVDYAAHAEPKADLDFFKLLITDVATVGGLPVGSDGAYLLLNDGRLFDTSRWLHTVDD